MTCRGLPWDQFASESPSLPARDTYLLAQPAHRSSKRPSNIQKSRCSTQESKALEGAVLQWEQPLGTAICDLIMSIMPLMSKGQRQEVQ